MTRTTHQLALFEEANRDGAVQPVLELKPYIQPFERVLARAELEGLLGRAGEDDQFDQIAEDQVALDPSSDIETLKHRLAYWQRISTPQPEATLQVRLEASEDAPNGTLKLPNRRKLRYGVHDLHEYRGKFFPQLVKSLINAAGLHEGAVVLDPTCGSGTTNCEARAAGMQTLGLDLNPLSVKIAQTKSKLLEVAPASLIDTATTILKDLKGKEYENPDLEKRWRRSDLKYLHRWFDPKALREIAVILEALDCCSDGIIKDFLQICLSNIVRPISWQKVSDLRVRKDVTEYETGTALSSFSAEVTRQLSKIAPYLEVLNRTDFPDFIVQEGDAREIDSALNAWVGKCDVLITSPPYATALPYIDTDRLSLVVLGLLPRSKHRTREFEMIGNREILEKQRLELWENYQERKQELPSSVCQLIDDIAEVNHSDEVGFRRRNTPALLARYYLDMLDAMCSARRMMHPDSFAFYVVGNNSTRVNGKKVEIPTDRFLWEIGKKAGWHQEKLIDMELLPSRDIFRRNRGSSENILVFRSTVRRTSVYGSLNGHRRKHDDREWDFHGVNTQKHLHSIHPYPARFIPQIPNKAIQEYTEIGECVLDPFCGCGTTLLESVLLERPVIGVDNNAVAHLVSSAKTAIYSKEDYKSLVYFLRDLGEIISDSKAKWIPEYKNRDHWFSEHALNDLGRLRVAIDTLPEKPRLLALASLSSIIVRVSYQDSDTRYAKVQKNYEPGSAIRWFQSKLERSVRGLAEIIDKPRADAALYLADGRQLDFIEESSIDLIVTSPPYLNAYDYHKYHRHRLHWIEGDVEFAREQEIGKHDTFTRPNATPDRYFESMEACFREWVQVLRPGGFALVVIGDAIVSGQAVPVGDRFIEIFASLGMSLQDRWLRRLETSKKSFNQDARIKKEHVVLVRKSQS